MNFFENARKEHAKRNNPEDSDAFDDDGPTRERGGTGTSVPISSRQPTVSAAGVDVPIDPPETTQTDEDSWISGASQYGRPRGREAIEARRISQMWPMELIANGITDQLLGGQLVSESDEGEMASAEAEVWALLKEVITGPHLMDDDLDDLIAASVADMLGPANAYWQLLSSADESLPVATMVPLDALTIRHNVNRHGYVPEDEPAYWQAHGAFSDQGIAGLGEISPVPLEKADLAVMRYPGNRRSYQLYPKSPSMQVLEALELLANSTTHHNRFYNDNEIPPGFIQVMNASEQTVTNLQDKIQAATGDPRSVEVIGGEGQAMWIEMGGTAVNLDVIEEQKWFLQLCLAAVGLGKAEIGMIEDVNRANGEVEQSRVFKRVTGPFAKQFQGAFTHIAQQFDVYNALDRPFTPKLKFSDPREEHARQERLRQQYQSGLRTYNDFQEVIGRDPGEMDTTVEIVPGEAIDYGDKPRPIVESLMIARRMAAMNDEADAEDTAEEMAATFDDPTEEQSIGEGPEDPTPQHNGQ